MIVPVAAIAVYLTLEFGKDWEMVLKLPFFSMIHRNHVTSSAFPPLHKTSGCLIFPETRRADPFATFSSPLRGCFNRSISQELKIKNIRMLFGKQKQPSRQLTKTPKGDVFSIYSKSEWKDSVSNSWTIQFLVQILVWLSVLALPFFWVTSNNTGVPPPPHIW